MILEDINVLVAGNAPYYHLQDAINAAAGSPPKAVIIPSTYGASDTYTNTSNVAVIDLRPSATNTGTSTVRVTTGTVSASAVIASSLSMNGVQTGVLAVAAAAAPITAATGGVFVTTLSAPGSSALESVPFKVKASGWITFAAGTYTATVQPLLHASTSLGFTASAASAIVSAAALTMTITSATASVNTVWETEAEIVGDTTNGKLAGKSGGFTRDVNGLGLLVTPVILVAANVPASVVFTSATAPVQFLSQMVLGSGAPATSVITLGKFFLET